MILGPGEGRPYDLGPRVAAVFKHDDERASISEWWLEPGGDGPGTHTHEDDDDLFYVLAGTMQFRIDEGEWFDAPAGTFVRAAVGTAHDFRNRSSDRAGMLNISLPGGFEEHMPPIAEWFRERDGGA